MKKLSIIIPLYNQEDLIIKALDSIPLNDEIEIIIINDASTDKSKENVLKYIQDSDKDIKLFNNKENKGVGYTKNIGIEKSEGEYIIELDSDDYFYTEEFLKCIYELDGTDIIYFDLKINDGSIFHLNNQTKKGYCGNTKFIRKEFIKNIRYREIRAGEDWYFYNELLKNNPSEKFTNLIIKHYNYPREGSLSWKVRKGEKLND